jgi:hypothetical protein
MDPWLIRLIFFAVLGAGIKAVDRAYDDEDLDKRIALLLAPFLAFLWVYLSLGDAMSATILGAIFLSSLSTGKIDNPAFKLSALIVAAAFLVEGFEIMILPLLFLTSLGYIDEFANGYADRNKLHGHRAFILAHRFGMKAGVALLYAASLLDLTHVLALYSFDLAYEAATTGRFSYYRTALTRVWEGA